MIILKQFGKCKDQEHRREIIPICNLPDLCLPAVHAAAQLGVQWISRLELCYYLLPKAGEVTEPFPIKE